MKFHLLDFKRQKIQFIFFVQIFCEEDRKSLASFITTEFKC